MKYKITSFFKKITATILAFFMTYFASQTPAEPERPDANSVTDYNSASADYALDIDASEVTKRISDLLFGIFFEDINFAADGGLYAEKVVNRSFEYTELAAGDQLYGWNTVGNAQIDVKIGDKENGLNVNNTNYIVITNTSDAPAGVENKGFLDGMSLEKNENYNFSVYAKNSVGYDNEHMFIIIYANGEVTNASITPEITIVEKGSTKEFTISILFDCAGIISDSFFLSSSIPSSVFALT